MTITVEELEARIKALEDWRLSGYGMLEEEATTEQELRHASWRALGGTAGTYDGDAMAAMKVEIMAHGGTAVPSFTGRMVQWLQLRLNSAQSDVGDLLAAWARFEGVDTADEIGSFAPTPAGIFPVISGADDANEVVGGGAAGNVSTNSTAIGLQPDRTSGFRFADVTISQGAEITGAFVQLTCAQTVGEGADGTAALAVTITGEDNDDAAAFTATTNDVTGRTSTSTSVTWEIPADGGADRWLEGWRSPRQRTPDLTAIVQQIVDRPGWASGNALALRFDHDDAGLGARVVAAQNHASHKEAVLYASWAVYAANPVNFDGTGDYLVTAGALAGSADSRMWTGEIWFRRSGGHGTDMRPIAESSLRQLLQISTSNQLLLIGREPSGTVILLAAGPTITDTDWHHLAWSVDLSDAAKRHFLVDGVDSASYTVYNDAAIDFTGGGVSVGAGTNGSNKFQGDIGRVRQWQGIYVDLSNAGNLARFLTAQGSPARPDLANDALGVPIVHLEGATDAWHVNRGTGGSYIVNGALSDGTGPVAL